MSGWHIHIEDKVMRFEVWTAIVSCRNVDFLFSECLQNAVMEYGALAMKILRNAKCTANMKNAKTRIRLVAEPKNVKNVVDIKTIIIKQYVKHCMIYDRTCERYVKNSFIILKVNKSWIKANLYRYVDESIYDLSTLNRNM